jgi:hypothetical protein
MSETSQQEESSVFSRSEETRKYQCGHEGPKLWSLKLFGNIHPVPDEVIAKTYKCGQCHLDEALPMLTQCADCRVAISPGQQCVLQHLEGGDKIFCLSTKCGPSMISLGTPGRWNGERFI